MAGTVPRDHHESHRGLLWTADDSPRRGKPDAIIVPTTRPVVYLQEAAHAAVYLDCPLVTLHSRKWTSAHAANAYLGESVDLIAIDIPGPADLRLPVLETSRLLVGTVFEQRSDLSTKRNLGLVLSHMLGWERVVFLDDDIRVPRPGDLSKAVGMLDTHAAVGLGIGGFPDNSMVCHAFRAGGGDQETFIGGGALAVDVGRNRSFFPNIYNEDWFYMLDADKGLQSVATVGEVLQYPYDPYRPERARMEEFGDVLAEGIYWLLDQGKFVSDGDLAHWRDFLAKRKQFIERVLAMVEHSASIAAPERAWMAGALRAALGRLALITPQLCVAYLQAWVADLDRWQRYIQGVRRRPQQRERALRSLARRGGAPLTWCMDAKCSLPEPAAKRVPAPVSAFRPLLPGELQPPMPTVPLPMPAAPPPVLSPDLPVAEAASPIPA